MALSSLLLRSWVAYGVYSDFLGNTNVSPHSRVRSSLSERTSWISFPVSLHTAQINPEKLPKGNLGQPSGVQCQLRALRGRMRHGDHSQRDPFHRELQPCYSSPQTRKTFSTLSEKTEMLEWPTGQQLCPSLTPGPPFPLSPFTPFPGHTAS